jgi:hypothetical protein
MGADAFVNDKTQWADFDGDDYGDNYTFEMEQGFRTNESGDAFTSPESLFHFECVIISIIITIKIGPLGFIIDKSICPH